MLDLVLRQLLVHLVVDHELQMDQIQYFQQLHLLVVVPVVQDKQE